MQPNKNLVFYLAGDENEIGDASQNQASASSLEKINDLQPEANELDVAVLDASRVEVVKAAELDEVDWIATLENIRHQRRADDDEPIAENSTFAQGHINTSALKVTSMKTTELYQSAGSALAAGKDLDKLSFSLKEAQRLVKNTPATEYAAPKATEAPVWSMEDLEAQIQSLGSHNQTDVNLAEAESDHLQPNPLVQDVQMPFVAAESDTTAEPTPAALDDLKAAAKQVPFDEYAVSLAQLNEKPSQELIDKANEVAEKTALSLEERHKILDGFLSLWHHKREPDLDEHAERKVMFKEEWQAHNSDVLQTADAASDSADQVLWLKTQPEIDTDGEQDADAVLPVSDIEVSVEQPVEATDANMYAPVHVHIVTPELAANERLSVVSEQELLAQLAIKLKPYFVDMLAGLVRNELNRQTTALVQRLQDNISEEIPMLVDDVLQENLLNVLNEIKQSQSQ